jgi:hypothetical protein
VPEPAAESWVLAPGCSRSADFAVGPAVPVERPSAPVPVPGAPRGMPIGGALRRQPCVGLGQPGRPRWTTSGSSRQCRARRTDRALLCCSARAPVRARRRGSWLPILLFVLRVLLCRCWTAGAGRTDLTSATNCSWHRPFSHIASDMPAGTNSLSDRSTPRTTSGRANRALRSRSGTERPVRRRPGPGRGRSRRGFRRRARHPDRPTGHRRPELGRRARASPARAPGRRPASGTPRTCGPALPRALLGTRTAGGLGRRFGDFLGRLGLAFRRVAPGLG